MITPLYCGTLFTLNELIMAYTGLTVEYAVNAKGDRWFIPYNAPEASKADQLAQCGKMSPDGAGSKD